MTDGAVQTVLIIGAGFGGLCLALELERQGIDFTILEKGSDVGGTWRDNTYPGAACDVPSFQYCFSFAQKSDWSRKWAPQPEILAYIHDLVDRHGLARRLRLDTEVASAVFDEARSHWVVKTTNGQEYCARFLVSAVGQLNRPHVPHFDGLEEFRGVSFHSARWRKDVDLSDKTVAVIGNAASAVQLVPEIAGRARKLLVFQRSPNWIIPKNDGPYTPREIALFRRLPFLVRLYRWLIWLLLELRFPTLIGSNLSSYVARRMALRHLNVQVPDPELRRLLLPSYPIGAKRILITDDYYPALLRPNVSLVTAPIDGLTSTGVRTHDGSEHPADVIVFATGFETTSFLAPMRVVGRGGATLDETWKDGAEAYLGITVPGFPNFFMMYGPNTNLGHNSILFMLECQARYIVSCVKEVERRKLRSLEPREEIFRAYNRRVQEELGRTVWSRIDASWYKTASGRITNNWYGPTWRYWLATRRPDFTAFRTETA